MLINGNRRHTSAFVNPGGTVCCGSAPIIYPAVVRHHTCDSFVLNKLAVSRVNRSFPPA
jgi:hypothetical protein